MNRNDRQLINEVYKQIIEVGLSKLKEGMEKKVTLAQYRSNGCPKYEKWFDGGFGSDLLLRVRSKMYRVE